MAPPFTFTEHLETITYVSHSPIANCDMNMLLLRQDAYSVTLDGTTTLKNGNSNGGPQLFQQLMFSATNLSEDQHQLVLENRYTTPNPSWVDVDYILVTSGNEDPV